MFLSLFLSDVKMEGREGGREGSLMPFLRRRRNISAVRQIADKHAKSSVAQRACKRLLQFVSSPDKLQNRALVAYLNDFNCPQLNL